MSFEEDLVALRTLHSIEETLAVAEKKRVVEEKAAKKAIEGCHENHDHSHDNAPEKSDKKDGKGAAKDKKEVEKKDEPAAYVFGHFHYAGCHLDTPELHAGLL
jgi:hypothetical protein